jgi:hypothetical protein
MQNYVEQSRGFWLSEDGKAIDRLRRQYVLLFNPDGSFGFNDVPPGTYELSVTPTKRAEDNSRFFFGEPIGTVKMEVVVPEIAKIKAAEAVDLGTLTLKRVQQ